MLEDLLQGIAVPAIQAADPLHVAVKFVDPAGIVSRLLVEVVDVLGDDAVQPAQRLQLGNRLMGGIGAGVLEQIAGEEEAPLLPAGLRTREEFVDGEILRIELASRALPGCGNRGCRIPC